MRVGWRTAKDTAPETALEEQASVRLHINTKKHRKILPTGRTDKALYKSKKTGRNRVTGIKVYYIIIFLILL